MIEIETYAIYKILKDNDLDLFCRVKEQFFTGYNLHVYKKLESYYNSNKVLPSLEEVEHLPMGNVVQNYYKVHIKEADYEDKVLDQNFLVRQLEEQYTKRDVLNKLSNIIDDFETLEVGEVTELFDSMVLELNSKIVNTEEFFDAADVDMFSKDDDFVLFPTGLSNEFDSVNGGFALQELVLLGGRRGSGKSIITLNALRARYEMGHTVALFSIEMRYKEQMARLMSMVSGVPFLSIYKGEVSTEDNLKLASAKISFWYKDTEKARAVLKRLYSTKDYVEFEASCRGLEKKDNRFIIIDQIALGMNKINYYLRQIKSKYHNFTMAAMDYLNIIKIEDRLNWQSQIVIADTLKEHARNYNLTVMSPYQMDADGEARFAKGILDSADKSLIFMPQEQTEQQQGPDHISQLKVHTAKIRNGRPISFMLHINWSMVRVFPEGALVNEALLPAEKYGSDSVINKGGAMDLIPQ